MRSWVMQHRIDGLVHNRLLVVMIMLLSSCQIPNNQPTVTFIGTGAMGGALGRQYSPGRVDNLIVSAHHLPIDLSDDFSFAIKQSMISSLEGGKTIEIKDDLLHIQLTPLPIHALRGHICRAFELKYDRSTLKGHVHGRACQIKPNSWIIVA